MTDYFTPDELHIEPWPPRQKGGQHVGGGSSGVKITHVPTGTVAVCVSNRSQHTNKLIALDMILSALSHPKFR